MTPDRNITCPKYETACLPWAAYTNKASVPCRRCKNMCLAPKINDQCEIPRARRAQCLQPGYIGIVEAAEYLGVTVSAMHHMRRRGNGPVFEMLPVCKSGILVYQIDNLRLYVEAAKQIKAQPVDDVTVYEAAPMIGITPGHLRKLRSWGKGPPGRMVGKTYRYKIKDVEKFARERNGR